MTRDRTPDSLSSPQTQAVCDHLRSEPTTLLAMFNVLQLKDVAQEVEDTIVKIMKEATKADFESKRD